MRSSKGRVNGIGPSSAARLLVEVGDITRFPDRDHFASWNGTAPIDASSGDQVLHRLSRERNRQINRVVHIMATVRLRNQTEGRAHYDRRKTDGKTSMEALRALKRRLSNIVYRTMVDDAISRARRAQGRAREGQTGHDSDSSATGSHPSAGSSDKPLPGPARRQPRTPLPVALTQRGARSGKATASSSRLMPTSHARVLLGRQGGEHAADSEGAVVADARTATGILTA